MTHNVEQFMIGFCLGIITMTVIFYGIGYINFPEMF